MHAPSPPSKVKKAPGAYAEPSCPRDRAIVGALSVFSSSSVPKKLLRLAISVPRLCVVHTVVVGHAVTDEVHHQQNLAGRLGLAFRVTGRSLNDTPWSTSRRDVIGLSSKSV